MPNIVSLQRVLTVSYRAASLVPTWIAEATPLERAAIARYASAHLEQHAPLTPLEALIGASDKTQSPDRRRSLLRMAQEHHPALTDGHLSKIGIDSWSLEADSHWKDLPPDTQLLLVQCAAMRRRVILPTRAGSVWTTDVADVLAKAPPAISQDPLVQRIVACTNPSLAALWINQKVPMDPQALAIRFLQQNKGYPHRVSIDRTWYESMDDDAFAGLVAHNGSGKGHWDVLKGIQEGNKPLFFYPWDKVHLLLEHNPARFIHSVLANHDVANGLHLVKKWFSPMLHAAAVRSTQDPSYAAFMASVIFSLDAKKRLKDTLERYDPEALVCLQTLRELHSDGKNGPDNAVFGWLNWLAHRENLALRLDLPDLGADVGDAPTA